MPKNHQGRPATYSYPIGYLPTSAAEPSEETAPPPAAKAAIADWRAYAESVGVDPAGLSKAQIRVRRHLGRRRPVAHSV